MAHEEKMDGAGVEFEEHAPENEQPHVVDAVVLDTLVVDAVAEETAPVAIEEPAPVVAAAAASAPDFYAVGVRLIKMSPVWLLTVTGGFALLILLLSWVRPAGGEVDAASIPNDAKAVVQYPEPPASPAAKPTQETPAPVAEAPKEERAEVPAETKAAEPVQPASAPQESHEATPVEEKKQPARVAPSSNDAGGKFTIQVGSFNAESQANERISSLRAAGFDARSTEVEIPGRGKWFRVQVGRFMEREEAAKVLAQVREKGAASGSMVVPVQ